MAALLAPSGLVSLDVDDEPRSLEVMKALGVDLTAIRAVTPTIRGKHYRMLFRAPDVLLRHRVATWPKRDNPSQNAVIFELRAGCLSDTLPPTSHPGLRRPYAWEMAPREGFPRLPEAILRLWRDWQSTSERIFALCPWAEPKPAPQVRTTANRKQSTASVINAFNSLHDIGSILESHGYRRDGTRYLAPDTSHGAGVVMLESGKVFSHHVGDVLHGAHALDAFDCYRLLAHKGDVRAAVREAADLMGMSERGSK